MNIQDLKEIQKIASQAMTLINKYAPGPEDEYKDDEDYDDEDEYEDE